MHDLDFLPTFLINSQKYYALVTDANGTLVYANELLKQKYTDFFESIFLEAIKLCAENQQNVLVEATYDEGNIDWELSVPKTGYVLCVGQDVTQTFKISKRLDTVLNRIHKVANKITDGFYMLNTNWEFIFMNQVAEDVLGKKQEELLYKTLWQEFPNIITHKMGDFYRKAVEDQKTQSFEIYHARLQQHYEILAYPSEEGLAVFFKNITERHWVEKQLKYSENKLRAILDSTTDSYMLVSPSYKILSVNKTTEQGFKNMRGLEVHEGDNMLDFVIPHTLEQFKANFEKALQGEIVTTERELDFGPGLQLWFKVVYYPVYDRENNLLGVAFMATDIDKQKRAEQAVINSENKLRGMYDSYTDSHVLLDKDRQIISFNKGASQWVNMLFDKKMDIGQDFIAYVYPKATEEFEQYFQKALTGELTELKRKRYFERLDRYIWLLVRYLPVYDEAQQVVGVALNTIDITDIKEAEEKIAKQNEIFRKIAWKQSHEVRRPVANILGLANLLKEAHKKNDLVILAEYLGYLEQSAQELDIIIHDIVRASNTITEEDSNEDAT